MTPLAAGVILASALGAFPSLLAPAGAASINGDHHTITTLEAQLAAQGVRAEQLVQRYDAAQAKVQQTSARLAVTRHVLAAEREQSATQAVRLRAVAVAAYVDAGTIADNPLLAGSTGDGAASVYASVAASRLDSAIASYQDAQHRVSVAAATLQHEEQAAQAAVQRLRPAAAAAEQAVARDNALLVGTKANLAHLVLVAQQRHAEQVAAAERELARRAAQAAAAAAARRAAEIAAAAPAAPAGGLVRHVIARPKARPTPAPGTPAAGTPAAGTPAAGTPAAGTPAAGTPAAGTPAAGTPAAPASAAGYANPFRAAVALSPERIDQGVDFGGAGPIYAIGDGTVLSTVNGGWPGGTFIAYQLTDGPAAGLVVYAAEDISPQVYVGESVTPDTVLGTMYGGPTGIETGWASGGSGETMAMTAGEYGGANSTAFGLNFSQLLQSLGAPGGILQGAAYGTLPSGWPTW